MLHLLFRINDHHYALDVRQVVEVLPMVDIKVIPQMPAGISGILNYRGASIPVVDLTKLISGKDAPLTPLSTRIILVRHEDENGREYLVGLIAEGATQMKSYEESNFSSCGVSSEHTALLGFVANDVHGLVQRVEVPELLTRSVRDALSKQPIAANDGSPIMALQ